VLLEKIFEDSKIEDHKINIGYREHARQMGDVDMMALNDDLDCSGA